jgi:phage portal protein BeeE
MGVVENLLTRFAGTSRSDPRLPWDEYLSYFGYNHNGYTFSALDQTSPGQKAEDIDRTFDGFVSQGYKANGVIFACMLARLMIFSEARFQFRTFTKGRPGRLFGDKSLDLLEHPWTGATTGDLLTQMITDADLSGNAFITRRVGQLVRMRPAWTSIIVGSNSDPEGDLWDLDSQVLGYVYYPGGRYAGRDPVVLLREQVAHFKPIPDPTARFRGMSWLTPIVREVMADGAATDHKLRFFENSATPNLVITRQDAPNLDVFKVWREMIDSGHTGTANAYKNLYLTNGATATVVGKDLQQLEFKVTQGAGETRIAAAAGMHPVIVGLSEGMQGSSLNAGNFGSARRLVADRTMRPLWRNVAGSLETLFPPPPASQLWYDDRDIAFLREDRKDAAEIQQLKAATIRQLVDAGYKADTVVDAVEAEDMSLLKHSGLFSVQLQPPTTEKPSLPDTAPAMPMLPPPNGKKPVAPGVKP